MKEKFRMFNLMLKELYEYRPIVYLNILLSITLEAMLPLFQLLLSAQVIEWLMSDIAVSDYLIKLSFFILIVGGMQVAKRYFAVIIEENCGRFREDHAHKKITKKYLALDYPKIIGKEAQEKHNKVSELTWNNGTLFGRWIQELIDLGSSFVALSLYISILTQLESLFVFIVGLFLLIVIVFNVLQVKLDKKLFSDRAAITQRLSYLRKVFGESRLTKDVRIFQMNPWLNQIETEIYTSHHETMKPKVRLTWTESTITNIGIVGLSAMSYIRSVQLITAGEIPVSSFVVFAGSVTILAQTMIVFIRTIGKINTSLNEAKRYDEFLSQGKVFNHGKGPDLPESPITIELKNVTYTYPNSERPTMKNISLKIDPYENLAIVGENGAGKSTLTNLISGLLRPDSGEILINGIPQKQFNITEYYDLFAPVFQEKFLFTYSIKDTIIQGLEYEKEKYDKVVRLSGLKKIIDQFEASDDTKIVKTVYPESVTLSGGQLQKLKLAQALYKDAPILLLDEPTAALDPIAEHQIYKDYFEFSKNKTSVFISHRLSSTRFCDRIIYIENGEITEIGTHNELLKAKKGYANLYEAQAYYYKHDKEETKDKEKLMEAGGVI